VQIKQKKLLIKLLHLNKPQLINDTTK
jgi:hypothetical protein